MNTKIEWTDETWNPATGCTRVSPGCDNCYIERTVPFRVGHRAFDKPGVGGTTGVILHPDRLHKPLHWRKPRHVFVNSLSDLFHDDVPDEFIADVFAVMALAPLHKFQILTKRHGRMRSLLSDKARWRHLCDHAYYDINSAAFAAGVIPRYPFERNRDKWWTDFARPLPNVWLGVSVEDQQRADLRIPALLETPAAVRFLSCEPLLGPVDLARFLDDDPERYDNPPVDWVIVGGESGPGARPMHPRWARSLRDQCTSAGVPFFFKQWGEWAPHYVARPTYSQLVTHGTHWDGTDAATARVGKKAAGRELDGRTWDEYPAMRS